jgi:carboxyl-terminal processing protease
LSIKPLRVPLLVAAALIVGAIVGSQIGPIRDALDDGFGGSDDASEQALDAIEDNYFEEVDPDELEDSSVKGMIDELKRRYKDRFTHYFGPEAFERFRQGVEGQFSGVGLSVSEVKQGLRVARVFDNSPAQQAGIRKGDIITTVDGRSIAGESAELATSKIKGPPGSEVTVTVLRPSTGDTRDYPLTRAEVDVPALESELRQVNGIPVGYIELLTFTKEGVHGDLREAIQSLEDRGAQGLVLDLRGNGGGLLTEAVLTSSLFVEDGPIVSTEGRTQDEQVFEARGDALPERPLVVLVDGDSASASEIMAAALSDAGVATLVGQTTFGKGTFQEVIPLNGGENGALDLTIGEFKTRDGESINGTGVEPDVPAKDRPATKRDEALQRALQVLGGELPQQG